MKKLPLAFWQSIIMMFLVILCVLLAWQNLTLKKKMSSQGSMAFQLPTQDDSLPSISYHTLTGDTLILDYRDPTYSHFLLAIFAPRCPACARAFPLWDDLLRELPYSVRFLALTPDTTDDVRRLIEETSVAFDIGITFGEKNLGKEMGVSFVPTTILTGQGGKVEAAWGGPVDRVTKDQILSEIRQHVKREDQPEE